MAQFIISVLSLFAQGGCIIQLCHKDVEGLLCAEGIFGHELLEEGKNTQRGHDDVIKWKHFPRNWPFVRGIHRWPVNSPHKGQWRGAYMFSLICAWINGWVNKSNREASDLRRHRANYDAIVMVSDESWDAFNKSILQVHISVFSAMWLHLKFRLYNMHQTSIQLFFGSESQWCISRNDWMCKGSVVFPLAIVMLNLLNEI